LQRSGNTRAQPHSSRKPRIRAADDVLNGCGDGGICSDICVVQGNRAPCLGGDDPPCADGYVCHDYCEALGFLGDPCFDNYECVGSLVCMQFVDSTMSSSYWQPRCGYSEDSDLCLGHHETDLYAGESCRYEEESCMPGLKCCGGVETCQRIGRTLPSGSSPWSIPLGSVTLNFADGMHTCPRVRCTFTCIRHHSFTQSTISTHTLGRGLNLDPSEPCDLSVDTRSNAKLVLSSGDCAASPAGRLFHFYAVTNPTLAPPL
jgi:hypothetical protein